jgi:lipopolysaccharide/colanic/teichoic acid biosynthesis glycosyltransferase
VQKKELSKNLPSFVFQRCDVEAADVAIIETSSLIALEFMKGNPSCIVNLQPFNKHRYINQALHVINDKLEVGGRLICCVETLGTRNLRLKDKYNWLFFSAIFIFEFFFHRVLSKLWGTKKLYFYLTKGQSRIVSKAEAMGRLVSSGFDIVSSDRFGRYLYIEAVKVGEPNVDVKASYGPIYKMPRLGQHGKTIGVYKFRTMYPYSEFLHDYILKMNGYAESGKPKEDFRLTPWGKWMRKYWVDELPQLINVLKGEMRILGVRPVSARYNQDIPEELRQLRFKHKPGCIPPYVALNRKGSKDDVIAAEMEYLKMKEEHPYWTDVKLFFQAIFNIVIRRKRSA